MNRFLGWIGIAGALMTVGCAQDVAGPGGAGDSPRVQADVTPITVPYYVQFEDENPCTGQVMTVTVTGTTRLLDGGLAAHTDVTVTTSDGFTGRGTETDIINDHILTLTLNHMLTNDSGDQIRAHLLLIIDLSTDTVRVMKGTFEQTICVGA